MKSKLWTLFIIVTQLILTIYSFIVALDLSISLKYEVDGDECISPVTGIDICYWHTFYVIAFWISLFTLILHIIYKLIKWKKYSIK